MGVNYYNYHAKAKQLITEGHLLRMEIVEKWNNISPALVLYFDNHKPMPIRKYRWDEYIGKVGEEKKMTRTELDKICTLIDKKLSQYDRYQEKDKGSEKDWESEFYDFLSDLYMKIKDIANRMEN